MVYQCVGIWRTDLALLRTHGSLGFPGPYVENLTMLCIVLYTKLKQKYANNIYNTFPHLSLLGGPWAWFMRSWGICSQRRHDGGKIQVQSDPVNPGLWPHYQERPWSMTNSVVGNLGKGYHDTFVWPTGPIITLSRPANHGWTSRNKLFAVCRPWGESPRIPSVDVSQTSRTSESWQFPLFQILRVLQGSLYFEKWPTKCLQRKHSVPGCGVRCFPTTPFQLLVILCWRVRICVSHSLLMLMSSRWTWNQCIYDHPPLQKS